MATPPLLDFQELIAPLPGDDPAGVSLLFDTRRKLEDDRKEENPDDYAPDDPMRPENFKRANWNGITNSTKELLTTSSKDLLAAVRMTEALFKQHDFAGLRDGLHLLREMVDNCWDRMYPLIEDGDLEPRANLFHWLDDPDKGARMPSMVRLVPLVLNKETGQEYGFLHWKSDSKDPKNRVPREDFEKAIQSTPPDYYQKVHEDIRECLEEANQLVHSLNERMGHEGPGLTSLREAIGDCFKLMEQIGKRNPNLQASGGPAEPSVGEPETEVDGANGAPVAGVIGRPLVTRADVYRQLEQAANLLQTLEPHSPIPYLIQRAVELGKMPFPMLIKALIREPNVLAELSRELGIPEESSPPPEE
jgi:type VI secretion system protein ImpA